MKYLKFSSPDALLEGEPENWTIVEVVEAAQFYRQSENPIDISKNIKISTKRSSSFCFRSLDLLCILFRTDSLTVLIASTIEPTFLSITTLNHRILLKIIWNFLNRVDGTPCTYIHVYEGNNERSEVSQAYLFRDCNNFIANLSSFLSSCVFLFLLPVLIVQHISHSPKWNGMACDWNDVSMFS